MFADRNKIKLVNLLVVFARCVFSDAKVCPSSDLYVLGMMDFSTIAPFPITLSCMMIESLTTAPSSITTPEPITEFVTSP